MYKQTPVPRLNMAVSPSHSRGMLPAPSEVELERAQEIIRKAAGFTGREDSLSVIDQMVEDINTNRQKHGSDAMMALSNKANYKYGPGVLPTQTRPSLNRNGKVMSPH